MIVDAYVAFLDERPDFRAIALGRHVSAPTRQKHASPEVGPAALVKTVHPRPDRDGYVGDWI